VPKDGSSTDQPRSSQGKIGLRSESSANGKAKPSVEKGSEEVAAEQDGTTEVKTKANTEAGTSLWRLLNQTV
jgi:hypothetical protein